MKITVDALDLKGLGKEINQAVKSHTTSPSTMIVYSAVALEPLAREVVTLIIKELSDEGYDIEVST